MPEAPARKMQITARGLLLGERIDTQGLERKDVLATLPLMFRTGETGMVALFRFGVAVLFGTAVQTPNDLFFLNRGHAEEYSNAEPEKRDHSPSHQFGT